MKIVSPSEMQTWEKQAINTGATTEGLMDEAVSGMLTEWVRRFPKPGQALFFCGKGHNGNDGLWLAEELRRLGWQTLVVSSHAPGQRKAVGSATVQYSLKNALIWPQVPDFNPGNGGIRILVDALLGSGASGPPREIYVEMLDAMQKLSEKCDFHVSLDIPSGLDASTGIAQENAFRADLTLCLGAVKKGLLCDIARPWVGRLHLTRLNLPEDKAPQSGADFFGQPEAHRLAKHLPAASYKHQRGTLAIWAGSPGMGGAALLAAESGLRAGAGLVRLFTHPGLHATMIQRCPEVMTHDFPAEEIPPALLKAQAWIIGPGVGVNDENLLLLKKLIAMAPCPVVLDADALSLLARDPKMLEACRHPVVLTPHRGELEKLISHSFEERSVAAQELLTYHSSAILVAKGPNTLVVATGREQSSNASGNPGMASAGMGDVLSGIIGSLIAQGYPAWDAARLGVYWHGAAADRATAKLGEQCLNACDVISYLGPAWMEILD